MTTLDLGQLSVREVNQFLHRDAPRDGITSVRLLSPGGAHNLAVGLDWPGDVEIRGHAGYFVGGMNKQATITVHGSVASSVAENMMSGLVRVRGNASQCAGASMHGGLLVIEGDAAARCGISLKGGDIVVGGRVGHASGFMAQAGRLVVCGDAGAGLGDSLYEAVIYVGGGIKSLGADAQEEEMTEADVVIVRALLAKAGLAEDPTRFRRVASARTLYHWNADAQQEY